MRNPGRIDLQRRLLRAMLWMLGLSAAAGVLAVFMSTGVMGRIAGTALLAAVAVALAMPVSRLLDDEKKRAAGLVGLASVVVAFVLGLGAIWVEFVGVPWLDFEWRLAGSALLICVAGLLAANLLVPRVGAWIRAPRPVALWTISLGAACLETAIWLDFPLSENIAETGWLIVASGALSALSLIGLSKRQRAIAAEETEGGTTAGDAGGHPWRWLGVLGAAVGLGLGLWGVWIFRSNDPTAYIAAMGVAFTVAYAIVALCVPLGDARPWVCTVSIGSVSATAACVTTLSFITSGFDQQGPDLLVRVTGALAIVAACSSLGILVLFRLNRRPPGTSASVAQIASVHVVCPHCGQKFAARIGESACDKCGLLISIRVSEPRCAKCEYPLLDLKTTICPECGTVRAGGVRAV